MTNYNEIEKLMVKRITGEISPLEDRWLECWLGEDIENRKLFDRIVADEEGNMKKYFENDYKQAFDKFKNIKAEKKRHRRIKFMVRIGACAAILIFAITTVFMFLDTTNSSVEQVVMIQTTAQNSPILKLSNGDIVSFENKEKVKEANDTTAMIVIQNNTLVYTAQNHAEEDEIIYNELIVPNKCRYMVALSDSTKVWVNANSSVRFPVAFGKNERRVFITGEVLFEVAKDAERPFIVEVSGLNVKVLGTVFNINSYDNFADVKVTLVEGSVESYTDKWRKVLKPNEQLSYNKADEKFVIKEVNANDFTLWKDGTYVFKCEQLKNIVEIINRWYGIECEIKNPQHADIEITGVLDVNLGLEHFMKLLEMSTKINYRMVNEKLIIF